MTKRSFSKRIHDRLGCYFPLPWHYGRGFRDALDFLSESSDWPRDRLIEYKLERIKETLNHARDHVPYYRKMFADYGVEISQVQSLDDFSKLPILTKDDLIDSFEQLKSDDFRRHKPILSTTSGTTGKGTKFYRSRAQEDFRQAAFWHTLLENGFGFRDRQVKIGSPISYDSDSPLYYHDPIENALVINSYHILAGRYADVIDAVRSYHPRLVQGLPNLIYILAEYAIRKEIEPIEVDLVLFFGEKLYPHLRVARDKFFPGKLLEYYANRENTIAAWGPGNDTFAEVSQQCHLEVSPDERNTAHPESGDLITTSLHNLAFPLIRFNSFDLVRWLGYSGENSRYPRLELLGGRGKDLLLSRRGLISTHVYRCLRKRGFFKIRRCQLEQIDIDRLLVRAVPGPDYDREPDEETLREAINEGTLNSFELEVEYVDEIAFTKQGKFRPTISELASKYVEQR
jgi:phenylacetate-CoA ligase